MRPVNIQHNLMENTLVTLVMVLKMMYFQNQTKPASAMFITSKKGFIAYPCLHVVGGTNGESTANICSVVFRFFISDNQGIFTRPRNIDVHLPPVIAPQGVRRYES